MKSFTYTMKRVDGKLFFITFCYSYFSRVFFIQKVTKVTLYYRCFIVTFYSLIYRGLLFYGTKVQSSHIIR